MQICDVKMGLLDLRYDILYSPSDGPESIGECITDLQICLVHEGLRPIDCSPNCKFVLVGEKVSPLVFLT